MSDRVCVIGAGSSGLTTVKALLEKELPFDCFELGSDIGGNWRYGNDNGRSAAYDSLHIDTSKQRMAFSDFPMPADYPHYPHHSQVLSYFQSYAEHFKLRPHITFHTRVERVRPAESGGYDVSLRGADGSESTRRYRAVLVCNGHHWDCKLPDFPGEFHGETFHSRRYRNPKGLEGSNVLIVGIGNSAVDIACDVSHAARRTFLSTRRGAHIIPRFIWGKPVDQWITPAVSRLPLGLQRLILRGLIRLTMGDQVHYGIPEPPDFKLLQTHPTLSSELPQRVALGEVTLKPNIFRLEGDSVRFTDGTLEAVDTIIYATGYRISFPFFEDGFLKVRDNQIELYGRVVDPAHPGLYFIGLIQPLGAIMPLAELQARWVAGLLAGELKLPPESAMRRWIRNDRRALEKRYVPSARHTIQVDFFPYRRFLERRLKVRSSSR